MLEAKALETIAAAAAAVVAAAARNIELVDEIDPDLEPDHEQPPLRTQEDPLGTASTRKIDVTPELRARALKHQLLNGDHPVVITPGQRRAIEQMREQQRKQRRSSAR